jgi:hypothetical protein
VPHGAFVLGSWGHRGVSNEEVLLMKSLPNVPKVFDDKPMKVAPWSKI